MPAPFKSARALTEAAGPVDLYSDDSGSGKTYHDLLLRPDIQAVIVALPIKNQPEYIEAAISAGKHVLSEKPVAENLKDAEKLVKYYNTHVDKSKATWGVAENFRFLDTFVYARQEIDKMGKILGFYVLQGGNVKAGDKYFGKIGRAAAYHGSAILMDYSRDQLEEKANSLLRFCLIRSK